MDRSTLKLGPLQEAPPEVYPGIWAEVVAQQEKAIHEMKLLWGLQCAVDVVLAVAVVLAMFLR